MSKKRRSYEAGHSPKFMVVIDDSPECDRALYFASRRALRIGATVLMMRVIETHDRNQQWLGVADIMRAEAYEEANAVLDRFAARSSSIRDTQLSPRMFFVCSASREISRIGEASAWLATLTNEQ